MKKIFKDNPALFAGIALPLLLVFIFWLAGSISKTTVADPQYDAILVTNYPPAYRDNNPYKITIKNQQLVVAYKHQESNAEHPRSFATPEIYLFHHETLNLEKLDIDFDDVREGKPLPENIQTLNRHKIIEKDTSPDGYKFSKNYRNRGVWPYFFGFGYRSRYHFVLEKDNRHIELAFPRTYYNVELIGWVNHDQ